MNTRELLQRRAKTAADMRALLTRADEESDGVLSPDAAAAFDKMKAAMADLEAALQQRAAVEDYERRINGGTPLAAADKKHAQARQEYRIGIALAGQAGLRVDDGPEREISQELAKRASKKPEGILIPYEAFQQPLERRVELTTGQGAGLIGVHLDGSKFIDLLRNALACARLGATYYTGLDQNTDLPRLSAAATAYWVPENTPITTDTTEAFDKVSLRPKTVGAIVEFTRLMLLTSVPAVEDAVRADLVQVIARAIDIAALTGSGSPQPTGILNQSGLTVVSGGTNGAALTWANVLATVAAVQTANAPDSNLGWASTAKVRAQGMGTLKFPGVNGSVALMDDPNSLAGYPLAVTNALPLGTKGTGTNLSTLLYGAWSELIIAMFGPGIEVLANPYGSPQFASGNIQVRCLATCDVAVKHIQSFAAMTDVAAP